MSWMMSTSLSILLNLLARAPRHQHLIQRGLTNYAADSGSANAMAVSLTPALAELKSGLVVRFKKGNANNTGACTLNVQATGAKSLTRLDGSDMRPDDLPAKHADQRSI